MSIFKESESYRPFKYPVLVEATKRHQIDMHWTEAQVDLQDDIARYNSPEGLKTADVSHEVNKYVFDTTVCMFTELDKAVAGGYAELIPYAKNNEARSWFFAAASREVIHQRGYALAAETFGFPSSAWVAFKDYVEMVDKIDVITGGDHDLSTKLGFAKALSRLLLGEGIGLFAAFACLLNLKRAGLFMGFNDVNQWSLADEDEHVTYNTYIVHEIRKELTPSENKELDVYIEECINAYAEAEYAYIDLAFEKGDHQDLTKDELVAYIDYLCDYRGVQLGVVNPNHLGDNPLEWMDWLLSAGKHDNFFEKKVTDYSHNGLAGEIDYRKYLPILEDRLL